MNRIVYLLAAFLGMTCALALESGVSVVDFTQGAGTWHRRIWKNGGKEFELIDLKIRPEDPENVSETPAALMLPLTFPGDGEYVSPIPGPLGAWRMATHLEFSFQIPDDLPEGTMASIFTKDNDHLWRQVRRAVSSFEKDGSVYKFRVSIRGAESVGEWDCLGHRRPWNALTVKNLLEYGVRFELDTGVKAEFDGNILLTDVRLLFLDAPKSLAVSDFEYAPLNPRIGQRIEFTFKLNCWLSDPYDPAKTKIEAEITRPDAKEDGTGIERIGGFYYEDFLYDREERDKTKCLTPYGEPCFKIRYCPRVVGKHKITIRLNIDEKKLELPEMTFEATPAFDDYHGFVHCDPTNDQYLAYDDGTVYWGLGMNVRSPFDNRYYEVAPYSPWQDQGLSVYEKLFKTYREHGINTAEVWMCSWWLALEWINDAPGFHGVGQYNQYRAWMLDYIVRLAEENGIKLIIVINNHGKFGMSYDTEWKRNPYSKELGGFLDRCEEYFSNAEAKRRFKNLADYMVARWSASPNVLFWKLFTEVDLTGPDISYYQRTGDIAAWHREMGGYLKGIDIYQHPITTHWMLSYHRIDAATSSVAELDLLTTDAYYSGGGTAQLINLLRGSRDFAKAKKKPMVITEFGGSSYADNMSNLVKQVEVGLWTGFFSEMPILPMYWWFALVEDKELYNYYDAIRLFGEKEDRRGMTSTAFDVPETSLQASELRKNDRLMYWIFDKAFFFPDVENLTPVVQNGKKMTVMAPEPGEYTMEFWSPSNGKLMETKDLSVVKDAKTIELALPSFSRSIAVKIIKK
ncbi:MAG: hypothetical protein IKP58_17530 [Victivallales bacterium]|nr:hypothetical protein [Victivallales bacterium]